MHGEERLVREWERKRITGIGRTTAWQLEREDRFPRRVALVGGRVAWRLSELLDWVQSRRRKDRDAW